MFDINLNLKLPSGEYLSSLASSARELAEQALPVVKRTLSDMASYTGDKLSSLASATFEMAKPLPGQAFTYVKNSLGFETPTPGIYERVRNFISPPEPTNWEQAYQMASNALSTPTGLSLLGHSFTTGETAATLIALYAAGKYILAPVARKLTTRTPAVTNEPPSSSPPATEPVRPSNKKDAGRQLFEELMQVYGHIGGNPHAQRRTE